MAVYVPDTEPESLDEMLQRMVRESSLPNPERDERERRQKLASAQWGDARALRVPQKAQGLIYLGNEDADSHLCLGLCNEHHVLVNGGTRSGKGVARSAPSSLN